MSIEFGLLISIIAVLFSVFFGLTTQKRNQKCDDKNEATQLTTVIVKLENISNNIAEIKSEVLNIKNDLKEMRDRLIKVEESVKTAHHRLDEYKIGGV